MSILGILLAAVASYGFGAVWYMALSKPWMAAVGLTEDDVNQSNPVPYIVTFVAALAVAAMMAHVFATAGVTGLWLGVVSGFGLGGFIALPWIVSNHAFGGKLGMLTLIDGGYCTIGCTVMGAVLGLFAG